MTPEEVVDVLQRLLPGLQGRQDTLLNSGEGADLEPILFH